MHFPYFIWSSRTHSYTQYIHTHTISKLWDVRTNDSYLFFSLFQLLFIICRIIRSYSRAILFSLSLSLSPSPPHCTYITLQTLFSLSLLTLIRPHHILITNSYIIDYDNPASLYRPINYYPIRTPLHTHYTPHWPLPPSIILTLSVTESHLSYPPFASTLIIGL